MSTANPLTASCHCGAVRMQVARAPESITECNCSICRRLGALWAYYHPKDVTVIDAGKATRAYSHGDRSLAFHHCQICGCVTHWQSLDPNQNERMAINARLLDNGFKHYRVRQFDGADSWRYLT